MSNPANFPYDVRTNVEALLEAVELRLMAIQVRMDSGLDRQSRGALIVDLLQGVRDLTQAVKLLTDRLIEVEGLAEGTERDIQESGLLR